MTQSSFSHKFGKPHLVCDADHTAHATSASDPPTLWIPSDAAIEHFDVLLGAVGARLRQAVADARTEAINTGEARALQRLRVVVIECVEALEQLQATQQYLRSVGDGSGAMQATR